VQKSKEEQEAEAAAKAEADSKANRRRAPSSDEATAETATLMPGEGFQFPRWLMDAVPVLINTAEQLIQGHNKGKQKKAWVKDMLKSLARNHDIKAVPNFVEHPLEEAAIDIIVEVSFMMMPLSRKPEKASATKAA
jgi:hypothetical protein